MPCILPLRVREREIKKKYHFVKEKGNFIVFSLHVKQFRVYYNSKLILNRPARSEAFYVTTRKVLGIFIFFKHFYFLQAYGDKRF